MTFLELRACLLINKVSSNDYVWNFDISYKFDLVTLAKFRTQIDINYVHYIIISRNPILDIILENRCRTFYTNNPAIYMIIGHIYTSISFAII